MNSIIDNIAVGRNIKQMRELKGLTRKNMCGDLNISHRSYSAIENGEISITIDKLNQIAEILEVSVLNILGFSSEKIFNQIVNQNSGNNGENINHKEVVNDISFIDKILASKEETIKVLKDQVSMYSDLLKRTK